MKKIYLLGMLMALLAFASVHGQITKEQCVSQCESYVTRATTQTCDADCQAENAYLQAIKGNDITVCASLSGDYVNSCKDKIAVQKVLATQELASCSLASDLGACETSVVQVLSLDANVRMDCSQLQSSAAKSACTTLEANKAQIVNRAASAEATASSGGSIIPYDALLLGAILALVVVLIVATIRFNVQRKRLESTIKDLEGRLGGRLQQQNQQQ